MSFLGTVGTLAADASPIGAFNAVANKLSGNNVGFDPTPGFSAQNVIQTQLNNRMSAPLALGSSSSPTGLTVINPGSGGLDTSTLANGIDTGASSGYTGGGGVTYTQGVNDPATLSAYAANIGAIQNALSRLDNQAAIGNQNIDTGYNQNLTQLNNAKATNQNAYQTSKNQTGQDFVTAKNTIGSFAGNSLNGLERLLAARGAGGSSAALYQAPQAVAQQASQQRSQAGQTFGQNNQNLDTNWNNYLTDYQNSINGLNSQHTNQQHALQAQIDTTRSSLLQSLASLLNQQSAATSGTASDQAQPLLDQSNALLGQADQLGLQVPTYQVSNANYQAPSLASYSVNPFATPQASQQDALTQSVTPYLSLLLGSANRNKNQQPNLSA